MKRAKPKKTDSLWQLGGCSRHTDHLTFCTTECPQSCILQAARSSHFCMLLAVGYSKFPLLQAGYLNKLWSPTLPRDGGTFLGSVYNPSWSWRYSPRLGLQPFPELEVIPGLFILQVPASTPISSLLLTENLITICISAQEMEGWSVAGVPRLLQG